MTNTDKLKFIVEQVDGMCWHEGNGDTPHKCFKCGEERVCYHDHIRALNPSPDDLNALFDIAERLGYTSHLIRPEGENERQCISRGVNTPIHKGTGCTNAEALLNALYKACGGE